jgi:hypothetical protein
MFKAHNETSSHAIRESIVISLDLEDSGGNCADLFARAQKTTTAHTHQLVVVEASAFLRTPWEVC